MMLTHVAQVLLSSRHPAHAGEAGALQHCAVLPPLARGGTAAAGSTAPGAATASLSELGPKPCSQDPVNP